jgi:hypothetical protein
MEIELFKILNEIAIMSENNEIDYNSTVSKIEKTLQCNFKQSINELPKNGTYILAISYSGYARPIFVKNIKDGVRFKAIEKSWCYLEIFD